MAVSDISRIYALLLIECEYAIITIVQGTVPDGGVELVDHFYHFAVVPRLEPTDSDSVLDHIY